MTPNGVNFYQRRYLPISGDLASELAIRAGDLFVSRGNGSLHMVGRSILAKERSEVIVFPGTMIRVRLIDIGPLRSPVNYACASRSIRQQIEMKARTTAGIYKLSQRDVEEFVVPLIPLDEKHQIVAAITEKLSQMEGAEAAIDYGLLRAARLRQSMLMQAFEGKRVPQDQHDETASVLLERLTAAGSGKMDSANGAARTRRSRRVSTTRTSEE